MGRKVMVDLDDLELIQSFAECGDTAEVEKIVRAVIKEVK